MAVEGLGNEKKVFQSTTKPTKIVVEGGLQQRLKVSVVVDGHFSSSERKRKSERSSEPMNPGIVSKTGPVSEPVR
jgi:hypothetical protein